MMRCLFCIIAAAVCLFSGCAHAEANPSKDNGTSKTEATVSEVPMWDWGITLSVKNVTEKGLTLVCTQSGGDPTGELQTGSWYEIQRFENGFWKEAEYTAVEKEYVGWTAEAWSIPKGETVEWEVDWSWLYDALPDGEYRIGKEIMDFRDTGDYDKTVIYAEFTIG